MRRAPGKSQSLPARCCHVQPIGQTPSLPLAVFCKVKLPHARLLGSDVGGALMGLQVETGVPIAWGVLTPDTQEQALERAGLKHGNKGREAALAAVEMASVVEQVLVGDKGARKIGFKGA